jgi:hypothetical protein
LRALNAGARDWKTLGFKTGGRLGLLTLSGCLSGRFWGRPGRRNVMSGLDDQGLLRTGCLCPLFCICRKTKIFPGQKDNVCGFLLVLVNLVGELHMEKDIESRHMEHRRKEEDGGLPYIFRPFIKNFRLLGDILAQLSPLYS